VSAAKAESWSEDSDLKQVLIDELTGRGGFATGNNIRKIECPECGKREGYSFVDKPFTIHCPRKNECGVKTSVKALRPDLFTNWSKRYPATAANPNATAEQYLKSRALDPSQFEFEQATWREGNQTFTTIAFKCSWTTRRWHRLVEKTKDKTRWDKGNGPAYQGHAWTTGEIDETKELWIVEGILEALSVQQGLGIQAAATFSATHIPEKFYEELQPTQPLVIALNSDAAGISGTHKNLAKLKELEFTNVKAIQTPRGTDLNDLLFHGDFSEENREETLKRLSWRGKLLLAETIEEYRRAYEQEYTGKDGFYHGLLEFKGATYHCSTKVEGRGDDKLTVSVTEKVVDATIKRAFTRINEERQFNAEHRYFLKVNPIGRPERIIELTAAELVTANQARIAFKSKADVLLLDTKPEVMNALITRLERQKAPNVRLVDRLGYDEKSGCYVFGNFLYDPEGKRHQANSEGFFAEHGLVCQTNEDLIDRYEQIDLKHVIRLLRRIYGNQGLMVLAFYVVTLLKHEVLQRNKAFPYQSLSGEKGSGKTTLIDFLNQAFFQLWQGVSASRSSTYKGLSRMLYHRHSLVVPYNESNADLIGLDENQLLTGYHGGSLYTRAAQTNDSSVINLPFDASLVFVQNLEPFSIGAVKERVISLRFKNAAEGGVSDDSREAIKELNALSTTQRAGIGHRIFSDLKSIQQKIFADLNGLEAYLTNEVESPRVAFTHALLMSACQALLTSADFDFEEIKEMKLAEDMIDLAKKKDRQTGGENDVANAFFENFEELRTVGVEKNDDRVYLNEKEHYLADQDHYWIRLSQVERVMRLVGYNVPPNLSRKLKEADGRFVGQTQRRGWNSNKQERCWQFRREFLDEESAQSSTLV
jgi:hypothetical protein